MMKSMFLAISLGLSFSAMSAEQPCSKKIVEDQVNALCTKLSEKGEALKSEWPAGLLFKNCGDNYMWVQDTSPEIKMVFHPIKARLIGQEIGKQTDENKFVLFSE